MTDKTHPILSPEEIAELERFANLCGPHLPLRIEEDWTAEIYGASGDLIGKIMSPKHMTEAHALVLALNSLPSLLTEIKRGRELLTADEVMTEVEEVASEPVKKALRMVYDGNAPRGEGKGEIAQVVLKDLALERVTMFRRKTTREETPIRVRHRARAAREPVDHCEQCGVAIYEGDAAFIYADGPTFCKEHAPTWNDLKTEQDELIRDGVWVDLFEEPEEAEGARNAVLKRIADGEGDQSAATPIPVRARAALEGKDNG